MWKQENKGGRGRKGDEKDLNESWWRWYMIGGKRDQLAFDVALQETKIDVNYFPCRETIDRWSDANPIDGVWWKNKGLLKTVEWTHGEFKLEGNEAWLHAWRVCSIIYPVC